MGIKSNLFASLGALAIILVDSSAYASPGKWYFYITNGNGSRLTELYVAEQDKPWSYFNIGSGVAPGQTVKIIWDNSTDSQACSQWVKAVYADGSQSTPVKMDFCQDLDNPIIFY